MLLLVVATGYESLFLRHGVSLIDEGWTLYAAMRLHDGGVLYRDVLFVFPPGHLLAAWIAWGVDPPGITLARALYSAFNVAACVAIYLLGRRLMPASWALLGALLLAVAAPLSHLTHHLFGYRYLVFSALALLAFAQRLRSGDARWLVVAGALTGVSLCFRLTPAVAAAAGIALGIVASRGAPRGWLSAWLSDGGRFALGLALVAVPVFGWLAASVGPETLWREIVMRPVVMTERQSLPLPALGLPLAWSRNAISDAFVALQFRLFPLLFLGYAVALAVGWRRARERPQPLLLAVVVWGGVFFFRSAGRSDFGHLESALPPVCLLLAHAFHRSDIRVGVLVLGLWVFLSGSDRVLDAEWRGTHPLVASGGATSLTREGWTHNLDLRVEALRKWSAPGDTVLDLSSAPLLYALADRPGPGWFDIVIPGTFLDEGEEASFIELLEREPPALVVWPVQPFDGRAERGATETAPRLLRWVARHYEYVVSPELAIARPRERPLGR